MDAKKILGNKGEAIAAKYLIKKGLVFIEKNFYAQGGEIDLIFKNPQTKNYVFVEVKTRTYNSLSNIKESVTRFKIMKMLSAISAYFFKKLHLAEMPAFQIDAIFLEVKNNKIFCEHVENIGMDDF